MNYIFIFEQIIDGSIPPGYYFAHIPAVGLTTHGLGIEGARKAAEDLLQLWIAEKAANNEKILNPEILVSTLDPDVAV